MKQIARYKIEFDSIWITGSALLMGIATFIQAFYFLALGKYETVTGAYLAFFMIVPMVLEVAWFVLLKGVKLNAAGIYGILSILVMISVVIQNYFGHNVLQMVLSTIACLGLAGLALMITGGYFPYKLTGVAAFGLVFAIRLFVFDWKIFIQASDWQGFLPQIPALCMIGSIALFFCGITRVQE